MWTCKKVYSINDSTEIPYLIVCFVILLVLQSLLSLFYALGRCCVSADARAIDASYMDPTS